MWQSLFCGKFLQYERAAIDSCTAAKGLEPARVQRPTRLESARLVHNTKRKASLCSTSKQEDINEWQDKVY